MKAPRAPDRWYGDVGTRGFIVRAYLPWLLLLSFAWELAQLPLYAIWREASPGDIAFAVLHCTVGDLLIGAAALALALTLARAGALAQWNWRRVALWSAILAVVYTASSEWLNTTLGRWSYAPSMPTLTLGGVRIGLSPLAQWLVVPPLALFAARRKARLT